MKGCDKILKAQQNSITFVYKQNKLQFWFGFSISFVLN